MRWLPVVLGLAACGDNLLGDPFALRDGTRLQLRFWQYEDGTRQWDPSVLRDTRLGVDCTIRRWSDGHLYCTPPADGAVVYGDAGCSIPFGLAPGVPSPAIFERDYVLAAERRPSRMYRRTAGPGSLPRFWRFHDNVCEGPLDGTGAQLFEVEELDAARVKVSAPLGDGRVRLRMLTSDDGMQMPGSLYDARIEQPCELTTLADGTPACEPVGAAPAAYFRDPACTQHVVAFSRWQPRTRVAVVEHADGCRTHFEIGAEESKFPLYASIAGACTPIELPFEDVVFGLAGPLAPATFETRVVAASRLQAIELADGDLHVPAPSLFDTALGTACERVFTGDQPRCLPTNAAPVAAYYADDACVARVRVAAVRAAPCAAPTRFAASNLEGPLTIYELGPPWEGPLYLWDADRCEPATFDGVRPHGLGSVVQLDAFAAARRAD